MMKIKYQYSLDIGLLIVYYPGPGDQVILTLPILALVNEIPLLRNVVPKSYQPGPGQLCQTDLGRDFIQSKNSLFTLQGFSGGLLNTFTQVMLQFPGPGVSEFRLNIIRQPLGKVGPLVFYILLSSLMIEFSQYNSYLGKRSALPKV
ncbi:unnamed protein product [Paramecium pentaurelia]|uniref:Uncharacterized protein n=1 Tax=Paramecium pentaurelia TaxID=43138 RepID=A0A8S1YEM3_9CILI|nr:unnamed protein product [Paramecium pentaurelia]